MQVRRTRNTYKIIGSTSHGFRINSSIHSSFLYEESFILIHYLIVQHDFDRWCKQKKKNYRIIKLIVTIHERVNEVALHYCLNFKHTWLNNREKGSDKRQYLYFSLLLLSNIIHSQSDGIQTNRFFKKIDIIRLIISTCRGVSRRRKGKGRYHWIGCCNKKGTSESRAAMLIIRS